jgi:hypothetical protein
MKRFKRMLVPLVTFSLLLASVAVSASASAVSTENFLKSSEKYKGSTSEDIDFENLPIQLAEGVSLEDLAKALNEPRILESKNVTVVDSSEMEESSGKRQLVFSAESKRLMEKDNASIDYVAFFSDEKNAGENISSMAVGGVAFDHYMTADWGNGEVYSNARVSAVFGDVTSVGLFHAITRSDSEDGTYRQVKSGGKGFTPPRVGRSHTMTANAETYWWSGELGGTITNSKGNTAPLYNVADAEKILTNNLGEIYPDYVDPQSNIELIKPDADLVPKTRSRSADYQKKFRDHYTANYGAPQYFNWAEVEIHHMIPLEYWGTNDVDNLIPLLKKGYSNDYILYHHEVTDWWRNYR